MEVGVRHPGGGSGSEAVCVTDSDCRIVELSGSIWSVFGFQAEELIGRSFLDLIATEDQARISAMITRADAAKNGVTCFSARGRHKDGSVLELQGTHAPNSGAPASAGITIRLITATAWSEPTTYFRGSEVRLRELFDAVPSGIFICDRNAVILDYNSRAAELWGREPLRGDPRERYCGSHQLFRADGTPLPHSSSPIVDVIRSGVPIYNVEVIVGRPDGSRVPAQVNFAPLKDAQGEVIGAVTACLEISERKRAEERLIASERRYSKLVNSLDAIVWEADPTTLQFQFVSHPAERILGYPLRDWLDDPMFWKSHLHEADRDWVVAYCSEATSQGIDHELEYRMIASDGRVVWLHDVVSVEVHDGAPVKLYGVMLDITERKNAVTALRETEDRLSYILRRCNLGAWDVDLSDGSATRTLEHAQIFGYPDVTSPWNYETFLSHVLPEHRDRLDQCVREAIATRAELACEFPIQRRDGEMRWIWAAGAYINDRGVAGERLAGLIRDITQAKQTESERQKLEVRVQQAQKLESLGLLAGGIAHDFNNLLTAIVGYASLAREQFDAGESFAAAVNEIEAGGKRAAELAQQLLAYSGRGKFDVRTVALDELVQGMGTLLNTVVSKKAVLEYSLDPVRVDADVVQLRQVVMNLITNASEAMEGGSGTIRVKTSRRHCDRIALRSPYLPEEIAEGEYVSLEVSDTGCGMTDETRLRLFDPFFSTKGSGRGLGLAAVLGIARAHRGTVNVISEIGRGATIELLLPVSSSPVVRDREELTPSPHPNTRGLVLIVDDEESVRSFVGAVLKRAGYSITFASNGLDGAREFEARSGQVQVIVMDLTMPGLDGLEAAERIRSMDPSVPILLMSGHSDQQDGARLADYGIAGFIQKPFRSQQLLDLVNGAATARERKPEPQS